VLRDQIVEYLAEGRGDIAAKAQLTSERLKDQVSLTDPIYENADGVVVTGPAAPPITTLEDLSSHEVFVVHGPASREVFASLNRRLRETGRPEVKMSLADENLSSDDVLQMVNAGLYPMTISERNVAELWAKVLGKLNVRSNLVVTHGSWSGQSERVRPSCQASSTALSRTTKPTLLSAILFSAVI
jgi:membrane-bound lytic murein transglycosylase MltF